MEQPPVLLAVPYFGTVGNIKSSGDVSRYSLIFYCLCSVSTLIVLMSRSLNCFQSKSYRNAIKMYFVVL